MLRHKRLNEVIATDTYFSSVKSIEGYYCAQVFCGMTSKMLYVAAMKTESELPDVYFDFIRLGGKNLHSDVTIPNLKFSFLDVQKKVLNHSGM
jgi:hypothetical protein